MKKIEKGTTDFVGRAVMFKEDILRISVILAPNGEKLQITSDGYEFDSVDELLEFWGAGGKDTLDMHRSYGDVSFSGNETYLAVRSPGQSDELIGRRHRLLEVLRMCEVRRSFAKHPVFSTAWMALYFLSAAIFFSGSSRFVPIGIGCAVFAVCGQIAEAISDPARTRFYGILRGDKPPSRVGKWQVDLIDKLPDKIVTAAFSIGVAAVGHG